MLELRPNCECCGTDLPPDAEGAMICSFECTFCTGCADDPLRGRCPNCGGALTARPTRSMTLLSRFPPTTRRVLKAEGCPPATGTA